MRRSKCLKLCVRSCKDTKKIRIFSFCSFFELALHLPFCQGIADLIKGGTGERGSVFGQSGCHVLVRHGEREVTGERVTPTVQTDVPTLAGPFKTF